LFATILGESTLLQVFFFIHYCAALKKDKTVMEGVIEFELIDLNYTLVAVVVESCNNNISDHNLAMHQLQQHFTAAHVIIQNQLKPFFLHSK